MIDSLTSVLTPILFYDSQLLRDDIVVSNVFDSIIKFCTQGYVQECVVCCKQILGIIQQYTY